MEIRRAAAENTEGVREVVQRAYARYVERIGRRPAPMDDDYEDRVRRGQVDLAVDHRQIVGVLVSMPRPDHLFIENVAVDPAHQGRGVGRALLAHAETLAERRGLPELRLYTNAAMTENLALYPRLGYRVIGRRTDEGFARVYFAKSVAAGD